MSLKFVHMVFIVASILLSFLFSGWSWQRSETVWAASAAALGASLVVYLAYFIRKMRKI
ncbi:MAG TPA: hypothetical protein VL404_00455 [Candidatus Eisenbacteria bacterium]|nr:hypothetical protein [Candidatus Eisenbacteria bacterium]